MDGLSKKLAFVVCVVLVIFILLGYSSLGGVLPFKKEGSEEWLVLPNGSLITGTVIEAPSNALGSQQDVDTQLSTPTVGKENTIDTPLDASVCKQHTPVSRRLANYVNIPEDELKDIKDSLAVLNPASTQDNALTLLSLWKKCRRKPEAKCDDMTYLYTSWLIIDLQGRIRIAKEPPFPPIKDNKKYNPVTRRGKGIKFINATHVVGLLGSAWEPPYDPYHVFIWNIDTHAVSLHHVHSHHDVEYNPRTGTFLALTNTNGVKTGRKWTYETIQEVDSDGNILWHWDGSSLFDYVNQYESTKAHWGYCMRVRRECADKVHGNTIIWDWENDVIYWNSRHLDAFYKMDKKTKKILWGVGRVGHFELTDITGQKVRKVVHHAHQLSRLDENVFMLFDNGVDQSSYTIIQVDEAKQSARVVWKWTAPKDIYQPAMGGVMVSPTKTYVGSLGYGAFLMEFEHITPANASIMEIDEHHNEVWKVQFRESFHYQWLFYRVERFYENPIIRSSIQTISYQAGTNTVSIPVTVYNSYYSALKTSGAVYALWNEDDVLPKHSILYYSKTQFNRYWLPTQHVIKLRGCFPKGDFKVLLVAENIEGYSGTLEISVRSTDANCEEMICAT